MDNEFDPDVGPELMAAALRPLAKFAHRFGHHVDQHPVLQRYVAQEMASMVTAMPIPLILTCPLCKERHIDEGKYATESHKTHACQHCGTLWQPCLLPTVGVRFLPGCGPDGEAIR